MSKDMNIGLLYFKDRNLGDIVIRDTARYLIAEIMDKKGISYNIKSIDIGDKHLDTVTVSKKREKLNYYFEKYLSFLEKSIGKVFDIRKYLLIHRWHQTQQYLFIKYKVLTKFKNLDAIIFAGGGMIKYHQQQFHYIIYEVTKYADRHKIPVIFNAVGVEGYDERDPECQILKKSLNRNCVKAISARDDLKTLKEKYISKNIFSSLVADSAVYVSETYGIKKQKSNTVGIGVIRPEIFKDYLYDVSEEILLKMFSELIIKLKDNNYDVKLFTNGAIRDQKFILKIKEYMNAGGEFDEMIEPRSKKAADLVEIISKYKVVVGARLHSNIIAYSLDIPIVGIVWNIKQLIFGQINNCEEYFITKENFNAEYIFEKIKTADKQQKLDTVYYKKTVYNFLNTELDKILSKKK